MLTEKCTEVLREKSTERDGFHVDMKVHEESDIDAEMKWPYLVVVLKDEEWLKGVTMKFRKKYPNGSITIVEVNEPWIRGKEIGKETLEEWEKMMAEMEMNSTIEWPEEDQ